MLAAFAPPAPAAAAMPEIPGWRVTGVLGAGGMGRVYLAEQEETGSPAAVKVLDARWAQDPVMLARFESEAETLRRLEHPGIVQLLDTGETMDGQLCLIMEYVDGCDLGRLLRAGGLPAARAAEIFRKVCEAVEHAHSRDVVHRDIKPSNILAAADGTVKLADFGLARDGAPHGSGIGGLTATTDQFGTAYYLAPERMQPGSPVQPQTDVFSLGVLLYHLFSGRMPLGNFTPLSRLAGLPQSFDVIVSRALQADPAQRTRSAAELLQAFEKAWQQHLAGATRRRALRRGLAAAAVLLLAAGSVAGGAWWQRRSTPEVKTFPVPASATQEKPWENSLGMRFVPVPGTEVLFSIWETRQRDIEPFVSARSEAFSMPWQEGARNARMRAFRKSLAKGVHIPLDDGGAPDLTRAPDRAVGLIFAADATMFCRWLTWKEQIEGRITPQQYYRLPTSREWMTAAGGPQAERLPGNLAGTESLGKPWLVSRQVFPTSDEFDGAATVGSFPVERFGLFDISGNLSEWVCDPFFLRDGEEPDAETAGDSDKDNLSRANLTYTLRGPNFSDGTEAAARLGTVRPAPKLRQLTCGFRVVLVHAAPPHDDELPEPAPAAATAPAPASPASPPPQ